MSMEKWVPIQRGLEAEFSGGNPPCTGGRYLGPVLEGEREYGYLLVRTYHGYDVLISSFFDFFIETLIAAATGAFQGQMSNDEEQRYAPFYLMILTSFRNFRAAESCKNSGYPLAGYSLLRSLKDRAIHLAGVSNGFGDIYGLLGVDPKAEEGKADRNDHKETVRRRKQTEARIMDKMVGSLSGLSSDDIKELERWRDLFHDEVHSSRFTYFAEFDRMLISKEFPSFSPVPHEGNRDMAMYMNRAVEMGWMLLRVFPVLQIGPKSFGEQWSQRWQLLDSGFSLQVNELSEMGKKIGGAVTRLMGSKFAFTPSSSFQSVT